MGYGLTCYGVLLPKIELHVYKAIVYQLLERSCLLH